ncbi:MAG: glycosyltransferase family 39 protein [Patescibacteria group bacterium]|nr:glycosyltransferase family 39 protein [Patescibacteria group bacterium]
MKKVLKKISKINKKYWRLLIVIVLAMLFFVGTSSFNYLTQDKNFVKWLSPDETANYVFAKLYAQEKDIRIFEGYNLYANDIMRPRSFRSDYGELKPVSFLGMILIYGKIAALTSCKIIPFLTPFFGAIGIIFFYLLIRKLFGPRNALISASLLTVFPPYVYYSARSMFHNVLFVVLLIIGLYFFVLMAKKNNPVKQWKDLSAAFWRGWLYAALAGYFFGLAIAVRTSELLWLLPALLILWLFNVKQIGLTKLAISASFIGMALLPVFYWNQILYSFPYFGGYPEMNSSLAGIAQNSSEFVKTTFLGETSKYKEIINNIKNNIFYFGFQPKQSIEMFYFYFISMFPYIFFPSAIGSILYYSRVKKIGKKHIAYLFAGAVISTVLIFYYGSWGFHDNPDPDSITIGNSYTRYWLPVYLGALPFAAWFIMVITRLVFPKKCFKKNSQRTTSRNFFIKSLRILIIAVVYFTSLQFVLFGSEEGLQFVAFRQWQAKQEREKVLALTEHNAAIITQYHDKLFFPERKVIVGLFDDKNMIAEYANLVKLLPVYYYNFILPQADIEYLNAKRLNEAGLRIEFVEQISKDFSLYRLDSI